MPVIRALLLGSLFILLTGAPALSAPLRVALMLEHDAPSAWTDMLRSGLAKTQADSEVIIAPAGEGQDAILRKAAETHDLVIVASDGLHEALRNNAASYRRVMFGAIDAGIRAPNIMSVTFADEQASYLAGAAAAAIASSKGSPVIGWLSGADTPAMRSLFSGYSEGAMFAVPGCRVIQAVVGSFNDPASAAAKAEWLINSGARVLALAAGAGNQAAYEIAQKHDVPVIELDKASGRPAAGVIAKAVDRAIQEIVTSAQSGKFRGKEIVTYDLGNGGVDFTGLAQYMRASGADPNILRRSGELRNEIKKGAIRLHSLRQRTLCDCLD